MLRGNKDPVERGNEEKGKKGKSWLQEKINSLLSGWYGANITSSGGDC